MAALRSRHSRRRSRIDRSVSLARSRRTRRRWKTRSRLCSILPQGVTATADSDEVACKVGALLSEDFESDDD